LLPSLKFHPVDEQMPPTRNPAAAAAAALAGRRRHERDLQYGINFAHGFRCSWTSAVWLNGDAIE